MAKPFLYSIQYSPWSEKARWALKLRRIEHRHHEYLPMIEALRLRAHTGKWRGRITVPALVADGVTYMDSFAIAQWADQQGSGSPLIPAAQATEVSHWNDACETVMSHGRALVTPRVAADDQAAAEQIPPNLRWIGPAGRPVFNFGVRYLQGKYGLLEQDAEQRRSHMRTQLKQLRQTLAGQPFVLGEFTFADVAMAVALQVVQPVADSYLRLGPATRRAWRDPELAVEFEDLLAWRDRLYAQWR